MKLNRREMLKLSAGGLAAAGAIRTAAAQGLQVKVPTCPDAQAMPGPDEFAKGPVLFRQIPIEPVSKGTIPAHWGTTSPKPGGGPCGIAKEFGPSKPAGSEVAEYFDDDDAAEAGKTLMALQMECDASKRPTDFYEVVVGAGTAPIFPGVRTQFLGYGEPAKGPSFPGPLFQARVGRPMVVRFINNILDDYLSVHLHGGHGPAHSDGHPAFVIPRGRDSLLAAGAPGYGNNHRDYFYPHTVPAKNPDARKPTEGRPNEQEWTDNLDYGESPSTMWYHDHSMDITGPHVQMGLAGFFPAFDDHELGLLKSRVLPFCPPKGAAVTTLDETFEAQKKNPFDLCLVFQDRCFSTGSDPAKANQLLYSVKGHNGHLGHRILVNGQLHPRTMVVPKKYRVRLLDGSNARIYKFALYARIEMEDGTAPDTAASGLIALRDKMPADRPEWFRIGMDTWLYPHPVRQHKVLLAMAKRADMIVDFGAILANTERIFGSDLKAGQRVAVYLCNLLDQENGRGPKMKLPDGNAQELIVGADGPIAVPSFQAVNVDGDTSKGELSAPWPLIKFSIEADPNKHPADPNEDVSKRVDLRSLKYATAAEVAAIPDASVTFGTPLREHTPIRPEEIVRKREVIFARGNGIWQINGKVVDEFLSNFVPELNTAEEWILENGGGGWWHPIHIHLESHQQIEYLEEIDVEEFKLVIGQVIATYEQAEKDERLLGNVAEGNALSQILDTLKGSLSPTETRPLDANGNLQRDANDEVSLQKLTKAAVKRLGEFGAERAVKLREAPTLPELLQPYLRLKKAYAGVAELLREFAPDLVFEDHRIWDRIQIQEWDRFKSDTTILGPNTRVKIYMKFRTFDGPFVFHCHNLEHEDMRMMFTFDPRPTPPGIKAAAESAPSAEAKRQILDDFHLREQPVCYRHPWRFSDTPAFDSAPHADSGPDGSGCKKDPVWNADRPAPPPPLPTTPKAHPIWGGWDEHL